MRLTCRKSSLRAIGLTSSKNRSVFPYLDFSTLARREAACRAELKLNRRLAPDVYRDVVPLVHSTKGLTIGGSGDIVDCSSS